MSWNLVLHNNIIKWLKDILAGTVDFTGGKMVGLG